MRYALRPDAVQLLKQLVNPATRDVSVENTHRETGLPREVLDSLFDALLAAGVLVTEERPRQMQYLQQAFASLRGQAPMLDDAARCSAFDRALQAVVRPGDVVVDVGSGTGILSFFAARAGASKVWGFEITRIIDMARWFAAQNGLSDRVEFIETDAARHKLDAEVDVVVGEWVGLFVYDEWRHLDAFARVRDANLRKGGRVVPAAMNVVVAPVEADEPFGRSGSDVWRQDLHGFDFRLPPRAQATRQSRPLLANLAPRSLVAPLQVLQRLDCATEDSSAYAGTRELVFQVDRTRIVHGFVLSFTLELTDRITLDASPMGVPTSWRHGFLPMDAVAVVAGDVLKCRFTTTIPADDASDAEGAPQMVVRLEVLRAGNCVATSEVVFTLAARPRIV